MSAAAFKDLVIDATDPVRLARFWADVLGLSMGEPDGSEVKLSGPTPQHAVYVEGVPEPVTVKQRVHLDVSAATVDDVLALGATPVDLESFDWKVLEDPEGGELCVFETPAEEGDRLEDGQRLVEVVVDCHDPVRLATWWADLFGAKAQHKDDYSWVEGIPGAPFRYLVFVPVPEPKTVKNRIHWDVTTRDLALITGDGATVLREPDDEISWTVLADPEGNEFCAFLKD